MSKKKKKQTLDHVRKSISIPLPLWCRMEKLADKYDVSTSHLIRRAIHLYLKTEN